MRHLDLGGVGVGANLLATEASNHIHESPVVLNALLCASPGLLLLLLLGKRLLPAAVLGGVGAAALFAKV